jgi:hypothetical protein
MTTKHTPRESYWRGHWAAIDGSAIAAPNDDADAFARGAERGAAALAEAMRCRTCRERWAWIGWYFAHLAEFEPDSVRDFDGGPAQWAAAATVDEVLGQEFDR